MSKLFDQLKDAARSRQAQQPPASDQGGLLGEALRSRSQGTPEALSKPEGPGEKEGLSPPPEGLSSPPEGLSPPPEGLSPPRRRGPNLLASPSLALAIAGVIFLVVMATWYANPWSLPPKKAWPTSGLKLDRNLDLQRTTGAGHRSK